MWPQGTHCTDEEAYCVTKIYKEINLIHFNANKYQSSRTESVIESIF